jgi:hypothetical protein
MFADLTSRYRIRNWRIVQYLYSTKQYTQKIRLLCATVRSHRLLSSFFFISSAVTLNGIMGPSLNYVEFYKYRRKCVFVFKCLLALSILFNNSISKAEEVYQCNNQTQTCITESVIFSYSLQIMFDSILY